MKSEKPIRMMNSILAQLKKPDYPIRMKKPSTYGRMEEDWLIKGQPDAGEGHSQPNQREEKPRRARKFQADQVKDKTKTWVDVVKGLEEDELETADSSSVKVNQKQQI